MKDLLSTYGYELARKWGDGLLLQEPESKASPSTTLPPETLNTV